jgi:hypothetical protein
MPPQNLSETPQQNMAAPQPTLPPKKFRALPFIIIGVVVLAIVLAAAFMWLKPAGSPSHGSQNSAQAEQLFYDTIQNASKQPVLKFGSYRGYFANENDANQGKLAAVWTSTSELDTTKSDYRNVYIYRFSDTDKFTVGRCLGDQDLRPFTARKADLPTTMDGAVEMLGKLQSAKADSGASPCPHYGVYPFGVRDLAPARLSDGVFPVGFDEKDSAKWVQDIKAKQLFDIKDEGTVNKDGKTLRKVSIVPKAAAKDVNKQLFAAFQAIAGEINLSNAYAFMTLGYSNEGGVKGYYLIDESAKLPVYSELSSTDISPSDGAALSAFNVVRSKQNYSYGGPLTLDATSKPDFVK